MPTPLKNRRAFPGYVAIVNGNGLEPGDWEPIFAHPDQLECVRLGMFTLINLLILTGDKDDIIRKAMSFRVVRRATASQEYKIEDKAIELFDYTKD